MAGVRGSLLGVGGRLSSLAGAEEAPSSLGTAGWLGARGSQGISREQSGCWQPASPAAGGAVLPSRPRERSPAEAGQFVFYLPGNSSSRARRERQRHRPEGQPGRNAALRETQGSVRAQHRQHPWGDAWGASRQGDSSDLSLGQGRWQLRVLAVPGALPCFNHIAPLYLLRVHTSRSPEPPMPPGWGSSPPMPPAQHPSQPRRVPASPEPTQQGSEGMTAVA